MPETLVSCPKCGTAGFTPRGLKAHHCDGRNRNSSAAPSGEADPAPSEQLVVADGDFQLVDEKAESAVSADFEQARQYLSGLRGMAQGVAALTVLLGFELERLHKAHGVQRGGDRRSKPKGSGLNWADLVKQELGISDDSARNYRLLAQGAKKNIPAIQPIADKLLTTPFGQLTEDERGDLLKKTKGLLPSTSAQALMGEWGITKTPKKKGGARESEPKELTPEEQEAAQDQAAQDVFQSLYVDIVTAGDTHRALLARLQPTVADPEQEISLVPLRDAIRELLGLVEDTLTTKSKLRKGGK